MTVSGILDDRAQRVVDIYQAAEQSIVRGNKSTQELQEVGEPDKSVFGSIPMEGSS